MPPPTSCTTGASILKTGLYNTYGPTLIGNRHHLRPVRRRTGALTRGRGRVELNGQSAHVGALFLDPDINPATGDRASTGALGRDSYTDYAIDGGYQFLGDGTHVVTADAILAHETADLRGSTALGNSSQKSSPLNQVRVSLSYFYQQTYGLTLGWQNTWGKANPLLYPSTPVSGSANGKPNSNAFIVEADWIPSARRILWGAPFANLKIGLQNPSTRVSMAARGTMTGSGAMRATITPYSSTLGRNSDPRPAKEAQR